MQNSFFLKEPFVDILEEPKKNSNVSSQLIYGESFKIISKKKKSYWFEHKAMFQEKNILIGCYLLIKTNK